MEQLFFYIFSVLAITSGLMVVVSRSPVRSALFLINTLFCVAGLFVLLNAHFLAAIQVLVYAGAIMVLFLFVIMLLNLNPEAGEMKKLFTVKILGTASAVFFLGEVLLLIGRGSSLGISGAASAAEIAQEGNTRLVGKLLFTEYLLPFEITSILLIVAIIGVVVLAKRKLE